jgi:hypothetical protein
MYHPAIIAWRRRCLNADPEIREVYPDGLPETPIATARAIAAHLDEALDEKGNLSRWITPEELRFMQSERLLCKTSWQYWAERYAWILSEGTSLKPLTPLWASQTLLLETLGRIEHQRITPGYPDGTLVNVLKAAQLGASTMTQSLIAHRCLCYPHTAGLIASDTPIQSNYLFDMLERLYDHLPWFLKNATTYHTKDDAIVWSNGSYVKVESGKSMRGALQEQGGRKGQMARGKTYAMVHLSELSTWERPEQLDYSLLPRIPHLPQSLAVMESTESTAMGRGNWWHQRWMRAEAGEDPRFANVFIPWFIEPTKYWAPAPADWVPTDQTLSHARRAAEDGRRWVGRPCEPTRNQLYWYERQRTLAARNERLHEFLAEYPANPEESFQHSARSIFPLAVQERLRTQARPIADVWRVEPAAVLRDLDRLGAAR